MEFTVTSLREVDLMRNVEIGLGRIFNSKGIAIGNKG